MQVTGARKGNRRTGPEHVSTLPITGGWPAQRAGNTAFVFWGTSPGKESSGGNRGARVLSASWRGNGPPRLRRVAGLRGWPATLGLRHGPDSYGRQQWGILRNGRKSDA